MGIGVLHHRLRAPIQLVAERLCEDAAFERAVLALEAAARQVRPQQPQLPASPLLGAGRRAIAASGATGEGWAPSRTHSCDNRQSNKLAQPTTVSQTCAAA